MPPFLFYLCSMSKIEILTANYWEHFKFAKELALILPIYHPKRLKIEKAVDDIQKELQCLKH